MNQPSLTLPRLLAFAISAALFVGGSSQAASSVELHSKDIAQFNRHHTSATTSGGKTRRAQDRHSEMLEIDAESQITELSTALDPDGTRHYRYQQTFRGIPVWGGQLTVSENRNRYVTRLFGRRTDKLAGDLRRGAPKLAKGNAFAIGRRAALKDKALNLRSERENTRQVIIIDDDGRARMAYAVDFYRPSTSWPRPLAGAQSKHSRYLVAPMPCTGLRTTRSTRPNVASKPQPPIWATARRMSRRRLLPSV